MNTYHASRIYREIGFTESTFSALLELQQHYRARSTSEAIQRLILDAQQKLRSGLGDGETTASAPDDCSREAEHQRSTTLASISHRYGCNPR